MELKGTTSTGKIQEMILQITVNGTATDFYDMLAWKINNASFCVLDPSGQQKMLTEIAKSTKAAIHLHGKLQYLFVIGIYFVWKCSISARI